MFCRLSVHFFWFAACSIVSVKSETDWHYAGVNIAYGKPVTQGPDTYSYMSSSGTIKNYTADLAVDGSTSGRFEDLSCTHTIGPTSKNAYWTVDLQKAYKITGIIIYNRDKCCRIRLKNFIIYGNKSVVIHNSKGSNVYKESVIHIKLAGKHSFSSITVQLPANDGYLDEGKYYLTLCEVKIYAAICGYMNITNGEMIPYQSLYEVNTQAHILCNEGFKPQIQNITCNNSKGWTYFEPCSRVYCAYPGKLMNGDYFKENDQNYSIYFPSPLPYGSAITVRCDQGYRSENTEIRTCQNDGTWSGGETLCGNRLFEQETAKQKTLASAVIGGISGTVMLVVIMISGLVFFLVLRRKKNLKHQEELMTYSNLRRTQSGPSNDEYAELNVTELE